MTPPQGPAPHTCAGEVAYVAACPCGRPAWWISSLVTRLDNGYHCGVRVLCVCAEVKLGAVAA